MMEIKMRSQYVKILKERGKLKAFLHIEPGYVKETRKKMVFLHIEPVYVRAC